MVDRPARGLLDLLAQLVLEVVPALGEHDYGGSLALVEALLDARGYGVHIRGSLGDDDILSAARDRGLERDVAAVPAHDLEDHYPVVRGDGVTEFEHGVEHGVARGVEADGVVCIAHVVVDGAGHADDIERGVLMQILYAAEGAVAAYDDEVVHSALGEVFRRFLLHAYLLELVRPARAEDGAAGVDAVGNAAVLHLEDVVVHEPDIAVAHAVDFVTLVHGGTHRGTDAGVHAGGIAAAGQDGEFLAVFRSILCHKSLLPPLRATALCAPMSL